MFGRLECPQENNDPLKDSDMRFYSITLVMVSVTMILNFDSLNRVSDIGALIPVLQVVESHPDTPKAIAQSHSTQRSYANSTMIDRTSIGSNVSLQEVRQLIRLHNNVRAEVTVAPLVWSKELASYAQEWANHLASTHCELKHRPPSGRWKQEHGENLFMGTAGDYGVADAVTSWASEKIYYRGQTLNPSNGYDAGHYTQMVWKNTKQIGCAKVECNGNLIVVCNYDPPGNILGQKPY